MFEEEAYFRLWIIVVASLDALFAMNEIGSITLNSGENSLSTSVVSGNYAYFGTYTSPGRVVQVNLANFTEKGWSI